MISVLTQIFPFMQMILNVIGNCLIQLTKQFFSLALIPAIVDWSELWGMPYNASKCKHFSLTKKQKPLETTNFLAHAGNVLSKSACEKDLGVLVNSKLSWHDHIVNKVNQAHKVLRLIKRTCGIHANTDDIKKLHINLVRPRLDYASQVWSPHQAYLSNMIEGVQHRATKLMV